VAAPSKKIWPLARSRPKPSCARALENVAKRGKSEPKRKIGPKKACPLAPKEIQYERDLRGLQNLWKACCDSAREEFQSTLPAMVSLKQRVTELRSGGSSSNHSALAQWSD
jgi:hypothetical protein